MTKGTNKKTAEPPVAAKLRAARKSPQKKRAPKTTTHKLVWRHVTAKVRHTPDYISKGWTHIELVVVAPKGAPLPITETGYRSHFPSPLELINDGGSVTFVTAWLDREAMGKNWQKRQTTRQQGDLLQWAETLAEVGARRKAKPSKPLVKTKPTRSKCRTPE